MTTIKQMDTAERTQRLQEILSWRKNNPQRLSDLLVSKYVWRGACLLRVISKNPCWWRNCLNGRDSRIHMSYGNEGPATFAFECDARFSDQFGYVQDYRVLDHFFGKYRDERITARLGLSCGTSKGYAPFKKRNPQVVITFKILDRAWDNFLQDPPSSWRINYRQTNAVETFLLNAGLLPKPKPRGWFQRFFGKPVEAF